MPNRIVVALNGLLKAACRLLPTACCLLLFACTPTPQPPTPGPLPLGVDDLTAPLVEDLRGPYGDVAPQVILAPTFTASNGLVLAANDAPAPFVTPLGRVVFRILVHPSNPLATLSAAQLRALFTTTAPDWGQVGGPPGTVQLVSREPGSAAAQWFSTYALNGANPAPTALIAPSWAAMREAVAQDPRALGYVLASEVDNTVKPLALDVELSSLLVARAPAEPTGPARDLLAWLQTPAGQAVVDETYTALNP